MATNPLAGLGKCALFSSFIFAAAIWWVVSESDASAYKPQQPPPAPVAATRIAGRASFADVASAGDRLRGTSPDARRSMRAARNLTRNSGAKKGAQSERERLLDLKTREIQEAQGDPNSMFDMSNP